MPCMRFGNLVAAAFALLAACANIGCHHFTDFKAERSCCKPPDFNCCTTPNVPVPKEMKKVSIPR